MELVRQIAHRIHTSLPPQHSLDDLVQDGMVGLVEAAQVYDAALNDSFTAFAFPRVRGRIIDGVRKYGSRNKTSTLASKRIDLAIRQIEQSTQRPAKLSEIADQLGIGINEAERLIMNGQPFDPSEYSDDESTLYDLDLVPTNPESSAEHIGTMDQLHAVLMRITKKRRRVFVAYFIEGKNLRDISKEMDLSHSRVWQLKNLAVESVRSALVTRGVM